MRIPVVAYRVDGIAEMINHGQTGFLHLPGSVEEMASDCIKLLTNPSLREIMGRSCRELAIKEFDVTAMVRQIDELYQRLLEIDPLKG
jgi:glycosyltransferase involved in cell wall biosynthesis